MKTLTAPSVDEIARLADDYAAEFLGALPLADSQEQLHMALSGTLLMFLSDVIQKAAVSNNADWYRNKLAQMRGQPQAQPPQAYAPRPSYPQPSYPQQAPTYQTNDFNSQQPPVQNPQQFDPNVALPPGSIGIHDFTKVANLWRGGKAAKLNPDPCPECGSPHFYSNLGTARRGPPPAPHCWNCGYNGLFEQGMPGTWGVQV